MYNYANFSVKSHFSFSLTNSVPDLTNQLVKTMAFRLIVDLELYCTRFHYSLL